MQLELAECCGKQTKQIGSIKWSNASNTQSVRSVCEKCGKKYFNWYQPDSAGDSCGCELIEQEVSNEGTD